MPLNFALFDIHAATDIVDDFEEKNIDWYVGGHSLGGTAAAMCAKENSKLFSGVILLASYSAKDISDMAVLSVYGDNDEVLNKKEYEENKGNLPENLLEVQIAGGNHANFGYYGAQKGDGEASISRKEQIEQTAEVVCLFVRFSELIVSFCAKREGNFRCEGKNA